jgi:hypothetical protein
MAQVMADNKDQLAKVQQYVIPGETLLAVLDMKGGGTGFLGITDRRIIFYDKAFMQRRKAMVTVPYSKISKVASEDEEGMFARGFFGSSRLIISAGQDVYEFEFRGADKPTPPTS